MMLDDDKYILKDEVDLDLFSGPDVLIETDVPPNVINKEKVVAPYDIEREVVPTPYTDIVDDDEKGKKELVPRSILRKNKGKGRKRRGTNSSNSSFTKKKGLQSKGNATTKSTSRNSRNTQWGSSHTSGEDNNSTEFIDNLSVFEDSKANEAKEHSAMPIPELLAKTQSEITYQDKCTVQWSGQEVMPKMSRYVADYEVGCITQIRVWKKGAKGLYGRFHFAVKSFTNSTPMFWFFILYGLCNNVILAMNRYGQPESEARITKQMGTIFTYISFGEIALKVFSSGIVGFLTDPLNCVSGGVAIINVLDMTVWNANTSYTRSFQVFNTLKAFKVIRMLKMLKSIRSMKLIIRVISEAVVIFLFIGIFLLLFLCIYALFGIQLFAGEFYFPEGTPRQNYDNFFNAFLSAFQVLNFQNWNLLLYSSMRARHPILVLIYYISWLIIGNYILINLFIAFMLSMFIEDDEDTGRDEDSEVILPYNNRIILRV